MVFWITLLGKIKRNEHQQPKALEPIQCWWFSCEDRLSFSLKNTFPKTYTTTAKTTWCVCVPLLIQFFYLFLRNTFLYSPTCLIPTINTLHDWLLSQQPIAFLHSHFLTFPLTSVCYSLPLIYTHFQAQSRKMKPLLATFLLVFLVLCSSFVQNAMAGSSIHNTYNSFLNFIFCCLSIFRFWKFSYRIMCGFGCDVGVLSFSFSQGFCDSKCAARCSKAGMKDRCLKYCGICCEECKCVPSGTYGNKHECPCYKDKKNSKGQPKCP